jgi:hypothetical protein
MAAIKFPERFRDLERFGKWAIPTRAGRFEECLTGPYEEAVEFYTAVFPRLKEIIDFLDQYTLGEFPEDVENLANMALSLSHVSFPVEMFHQMDVPNGVPLNRMPLLRGVTSEQRGSRIPRTGATSS